MKAIHTIAFVLLVIGGLNWLLVAFNWNLVDAIFGVGNIVAKIIYVLVGLSAIYIGVSHKSCCRKCESSSSSVPQM